MAFGCLSGPILCTWPNHLIRLCLRISSIVGCPQHRLHIHTSSSSCVRIISSLPIGLHVVASSSINKWQCSPRSSVASPPFLYIPHYLRNCAGRFSSSFLPTMSIHGHSRAVGSATRTRDLHSPQVSDTATMIPDQVNDDRPFEGVSFKPVYLTYIHTSSSSSSSCVRIISSLPNKGFTSLCLAA